MSPIYNNLGRTLDGVVESFGWGYGGVRNEEHVTSLWKADCIHNRNTSAWTQQPPRVLVIQAGNMDGCDSLARQDLRMPPSHSMSPREANLQQASIEGRPSTSARPG